MMDNAKLLLVVDLQRGFVQTEDTKAIVPCVVELVKLWQKHEWPIVCSRFVNLPESNWQRLRDWHELQGEPDTRLISELDDITPYVFKKSTYTAWSTEVGAVCAARNVQDVVIVGVDTNECVLATALSLFDAGLTPWIVKDACASSGGSKPHSIAIDLLSALMGSHQIVTAIELNSK